MNERGAEEHEQAERDKEERDKEKERAGARVETEDKKQAWEEGKSPSSDASPTAVPSAKASATSTGSAGKHAAALRSSLLSLFQLAAALAAAFGCTQPPAIRLCCSQAVHPGRARRRLAPPRVLVVVDGVRPGDAAAVCRRRRRCL